MSSNGLEITVKDYFPALVTLHLVGYKAYNGSTEVNFKSEDYIFGLNPAGIKKFIKELRDRDQQDPSRLDANKICIIVGWPRSTYYVPFAVSEKERNYTIEYVGPGAELFN